MKYDWEDEITDELLAEISAMLPDGIALAGIAVAYAESIEGALIVRPCFTDVAEADIRTDILGDADRQYRKAREDMMQAFRVPRRII